MKAKLGGRDKETASQREREIISQRHDIAEWSQPRTEPSSMLYVGIESPGPRHLSSVAELQRYCNRQDSRVAGSSLGEQIAISSEAESAHS